MPSVKGIVLMALAKSLERNPPAASAPPRLSLDSDSTVCVVGFALAEKIEGRTKNGVDMAGVAP
jgi:hypothetical protein